MDNLSEIEARIVKIEKRNQAVEANKAWETSVIRRALILLATYLLIGSFLTIIKVPIPWINAIVPSLGFLLSTLSLSYFQKIWIKYIYRKK